MKPTMADDTAPEPAIDTIEHQPGLSVGLFAAFLIMAWLVVVSVFHAVSMIRFVSEDGYFLAYGALCGTVPVISGIDRFLPFLIAAMWLGAIYLGLVKSLKFYRYVRSVSLLSLLYGAANIVLGPFTFRVGPSDVDQSALRCGRWPRDITQSSDLAVMQIDVLNMPISVFGTSLLFLSLGIFVYARVSKRVARVYGKG
jgi:hypothetical protein